MKEPYDAKVDYTDVSGFVSTAYLDEREDDIAWGTNKHSDELVTVQWTEVGWREVNTL